MAEISGLPQQMVKSVTPSETEGAYNLEFNSGVVIQLSADSPQTWAKRLYSDHLKNPIQVGEMIAIDAEGGHLADNSTVIHNMIRVRRG